MVPELVAWWVCWVCVLEELLDPPQPMMATENMAARMATNRSFLKISLLLMKNRGNSRIGNITNAMDAPGSVSVKTTVIW